VAISAAKPSFSTISRANPPSETLVFLWKILAVFVLLVPYGNPGSTIGYDPYWAWWYPAPVYYYSRGRGDNDCDDGNCVSRVGGHGGHHKPPLGTGTGTTPPGTASHPMRVAGIPRVSSAPAVASAPSGGFGNSGGFGQGGFGRSGFGGARGGFGHR